MEIEVNPECGQGTVGWCERGESNPYRLPYWILNPARLPVPPLSQAGEKAISGMIDDFGGCVKNLRRRGKMLKPLFIFIHESLNKPFICKTIVCVVPYNNMIQYLNCKKPRSPDKISCEPLVFI